MNVLNIVKGVVIGSILLTISYSLFLHHYLTKIPYTPFTTGEVYSVFYKLTVNSGSNRNHPLVIADSPVVNAWTDGKNITITTGLLQMMHNEDELALVLGHEISHDLAHDVEHSAIPENILIMDGKENEANADKMGAFIMMRAGFDVCKGKEIFKVFKNHFGDDSVDVGHPSNAYRLDQLTLPQCNSSFFHSWF